MKKETLVEAALQQLMAENDGVNPQSFIPIHEQLAAKRAEYIKILEFKSFKSRIEHAINLICSKIKNTISADQFELLLQELAHAGDVLVENPEIQSNQLGSTPNTINILFENAKSYLNKAQFVDAAALFTLCTVLDNTAFRYWFLLGVSLQQLKEYQDAIQAYETANLIFEQEPLVQLFLAECYNDLLDTQKAKLYLDKAQEVIKNVQNGTVYDAHLGIVKNKIK